MIEENAENKYKAALNIIGPVVIFFSGLSGILLPAVPLLLGAFAQMGSLPTAVLGLVALCAVLCAVLGVWAVPLIVYLWLCTVFIYMLCAKPYRLADGMLRGAAFGLISAVAALAAAFFIQRGSPANGLAQWLAAQYAYCDAGSMERIFFDSVYLLKVFADEGIAPYAVSGVSAQRLMEMAQAIQELPLAEKVEGFAVFVRELLQLSLPALLVKAGLIGGAGGWYTAALIRAKREAARDKRNIAGMLPAPADAVLPFWLLVSVAVLWVASWAGAQFISPAIAQYYSAMNAGARLVFIFVGIGTFDFVLRRRKIKPWLRALIIAPTLAILPTAYVCVGAVDAAMGIRRWIDSLDYLKAKNIDPSSPDAFEALKKHHEDKKREENHNDQDKKGEE